MKDSGIEWIGKIPTEWKIERVGSLFMCRNEKVSDRDFAPLSVSKQGVVPQIETVAKSDNSDNRKLVLKDDFVINSRSDRKQSCGLSFLDGSVSLINIVLSIRNKQQLTTSFLPYVMKNYGFAEEFYKWGHGIVADLWTTRWQELKSIFIPLPPLPEQQRIADYLDKQCSIMDKLAENLQQQIEKLKEYKQSVITEAVTKGLDPNVAMKDSGIEWIGQIPKEWKVIPIKSLFSFGKGLTITKADLQENGVKVINYGQIHAKYNRGVSINNNLYRFVSEKFLSTNHNSLIEFGDFIFADTSEDIDGAGNFVYIDKHDKIFAGYHTLILQSLYNNDNKFLAYLFLSTQWRQQIQKRICGIKVFSISKNILSCLTIIRPPLPEQQRIVDYLDKKCEEIDKLIKIKQEKIDRLSEYKKSLIYECVTGKKEI